MFIGFLLDVFIACKSYFLSYYDLRNVIVFTLGHFRKYKLEVYELNLKLPTNFKRTEVERNLSLGVVWDFEYPIKH